MTGRVAWWLPARTLEGVGCCRFMRLVAPYGAVHDVVKRILRGDEARVGDRPNKGSRTWYKHIWADCYRRPVMYRGPLRTRVLQVIGFWPA